MTYTLVTAGDVFVSHAVRARSDDGPWPLRGLLDGPGDVFVNVEQTFTDSDAAARKIMCFKAAPERAGELAQAGVDVVTLANNHAMDYGPGGLADTLAALRAAGVEVVGAGPCLADSVAPVLRRHGSRTVAFLGVTCAFVGGSEAGSGRPGVAAVHVQSRYVVDAAVMDEAPGMVPYVETAPEWGDVELVAASIAQARAAGADLVVVAMHWGVPKGCTPPILGTLATYQQPLGHALVDAGADVIVGHHAHVVRPIELYKGKPILYSVGDLLMHRGGTFSADGFAPYDWSPLADSASGDDAIGLIVRIGWPDAGADASRIELLPVEVQADGEPRWLGHEEADRVRRLVEGMGVELAPARREGDGMVLEVIV